MGVCEELINCKKPPYQYVQQSVQCPAPHFYESLVTRQAFMHPHESAAS
jgi:hypothetical protein